MYAEEAHVFFRRLMLAAKIFNFGHWGAYPAQNTIPRWVETHTTTKSVVNRKPHGFPCSVNSKNLKSYSENFPNLYQADEKSLEWNYFPNPFNLRKFPNCIQILFIWLNCNLLIPKVCKVIPFSNICLSSETLVNAW